MYKQVCFKSCLLKKYYYNKYFCFANAFVKTYESINNKLKIFSANLYYTGSVETSVVGIRKHRSVVQLAFGCSFAEAVGEPRGRKDIGRADDHQLELDEHQRIHRPSHRKTERAQAGLEASELLSL